MIEISTLSSCHQNILTPERGGKLENTISDVQYLLHAKRRVNFISSIYFIFVNISLQCIQKNVSSEIWRQNICKYFPAVLWVLQTKLEFCQGGEICCRLKSESEKWDNWRGGRTWTLSFSVFIHQTTVKDLAQQGQHCIENQHTVACRGWNVMISDYDWDNAWKLIVATNAMATQCGENDIHWSG